MQWSGEGIVLTSRRHGESSAIIAVFNRDHGRYSGLVRGGAGKNKRPSIEPGNFVQATWRARLEEHLGTFDCELIEATAATWLGDANRLGAMSAALSVAATAMPEREPHPPVFDGLRIFMASLAGDDWPSVYVKWELGVLSELGFGLDIRCCAATGVTEELIYVSPKSGRAVSADAGEPYHDRLLPLPAFLRESGRAGDAGEVLDGLRLTGYFLEEHVYGGHSNTLPDARSRFFQRFRKHAGGN
ncbi:MAG: DNA repair protein RecO [Rhodospirillales bacterium]